MPLICRVLPVLVALVFAPVARAKECSQSYPVGFPLVDSSLNSQGFWPSMQQSLYVSRSAYQGLHGALGCLFEGDKPFTRPESFLQGLTFGLADFVATYLPFFDAWLHEEYHRAVMGQHGIKSYNEVYNIPLGAEVIAVSDVLDEDLVTLKRDHPLDMIRLGSAGIEGELLLLRLLQEDTFYRGANTWHIVTYWLVAANTWFYVSSTTDPETTDLSNKMRDDEPTQKERDFTGHDFAGWVYDLFDPTEPYEDRGPHPLGNGIDRYRTPEHLDDEQKEYMAKVANLMALNFVNPFLINKNSFGPEKDQWNFRLGNFLTSFGLDSFGEVLFRRGTSNLSVALHSYSNLVSNFPGMDLRYEHAGVSGWPGYRLNLALWQQPKDLGFRESRSESGAMFGIGSNIGTPWSNTKLTVDYDIKSRGWVAGFENQDRDQRLLVGFLTQI